jgi:hypothetical protein
MHGTSRLLTLLRGATAVAGLLGTALVGSGCIATSWKTRASTPHDAMTVLVARSNPPGTVLIDGRNLGPTPLEYPLRYPALSERLTREVTLWESDPKLATALTILTGGAYLPSSLFPISTQAKTEKTGFRDNAFHVRIEAPGCEPFDSMIVLEGQPQETLDVTLEAAAGEPEPMP